MIRKKSSELQESHTKDAIKRRIRKSRKYSYLKDFIYGSIDGTVTTFAIISGSAGANFPPEVTIILGLANLIADGFSMAISNFLGTKVEKEIKDRVEKEERLHIDLIPEGEREEIRQIFQEKGVKDDALEQIVKVITSNEDLWVSTMLQEELGISTLPISPIRAALMTFTAFVMVGFLPLSTYLLQYYFDFVFSYPFLWSSIVTFLAFFAVGSIKSVYIEKSWIKSGLETVLLGGSAWGVTFLG